MITNLLDTGINPSDTLQKIRETDMKVEINELIKKIDHSNKALDIQLFKAEVLNTANPHTQTLTLHYNEVGNISITVPGRANKSPCLYSTPGTTFLFTINNRPFSVNRYKLDNNELHSNGSIIVEKKNPLHIDGTNTLYECDPDILFGSINLVDRRADILVFDRCTLQKIAWLPNDESAARFLVSLELLEAAADPQRRKVAEELVYHHHPAVAWKAFNIVAQEDMQAALAYAPVMKLLNDEQLNRYLDTRLGITP